MLDIASEFKKPVLCHTGPIFEPLKSEFCYPRYLDDVCVDYPDLTIQAAHIGYEWCDELFQIGEVKTNLVVDFSGWQTRDYHEFCLTLRRCLDSFTAERVLFGTDNPYFRGAVPDKEWTKIIKPTLFPFVKVRFYF